MEPQPLTTERLGAWAKNNNLSFSWNNDSELYIPFRNAVVSIQLNGPRLRAIGVWRGRADSELDMQMLRQHANDMNRQNVVPKAYVVDKNKLLALEYAHLVDLGLTDEQLDGILGTVMAAMLQQIEKLDEKFAHMIPGQEGASK
ncbi:YbjN domain-containing protein [Corynebacterium choanae]|uniref:YbjN domain-containing protein n=1 Tax=Corynebacterium choanae TaxID=1862358 RepID=A0A3G6J909_9CORY|nr:YbjN domain-containing protein [Corynebacterium choanae]AZA14389.1 hypothetical protein CCHOA_10030 [Corynebacterium choanae]